MSGPRAAKREAKGPEGEWTTDYLARQSRNQIGNEFYRRPQSSGVFRQGQNRGLG
jgi:hypothetical protein